MRWVGTGLVFVPALFSPWSFFEQVVCVCVMGFDMEGAGKQGRKGWRRILLQARGKDLGQDGGRPI